MHAMATATLEPRVEQVGQPVAVHVDEFNIGRIEADTGFSGTKRHDCGDVVQRLPGGVSQGSGWQRRDSIRSQQRYALQQGLNLIGFIFEHIPARQGVRLSVAVKIAGGRVRSGRHTLDDDVKAGESQRGAHFKPTAIIGMHIRSTRLIVHDDGIKCGISSPANLSTIFLPRRSRVGRVMIFNLVSVQVRRTIQQPGEHAAAIFDARRRGRPELVQQPVLAACLPPAHRALITQESAFVFTAQCPVGQLQQFLKVHAGEPVNLFGIVHCPIKVIVNAVRRFDVQRQSSIDVPADHEHPGDFPANSQNAVAVSRVILQGQARAETRRPLGKLNRNGMRSAPAVELRLKRLTKALYGPRP